jgi:hypothetical protein
VPPGVSPLPDDPPTGTELDDAAAMEEVEAVELMELAVVIEDEVEAVEFIDIVGVVDNDNELLWRCDGVG